MGAMKSLCASHAKLQDAFRDAGCVPLLVGLLSSSSAGVQQQCCEAMLKLSEGHSGNAGALCDAGAVEALCGVVSKGSGEARKQACGALWGLCGMVRSDSPFVLSAREEALRQLHSNDSELVNLHVTSIIEDFQFSSAPQILSWSWLHRCFSAVNETAL